MTEKDNDPNERTHQTSFVIEGDKIDLPQLSDQDDEIDTEEATPPKETDTQEIPKVEPKDTHPQFYGDKIEERNERAFTLATHGQGNKAKTS